MGDRFPVVEVFGPTIQGEGPQVGQQAIFVRFGGCDYRCVWCDSAPAVLPDLVRDAARLTAMEIVERVAMLHWAPLVVLSGGNPLLYDLGEVVHLLHEARYQVAVETQGSVFKPWVNTVDQIVVSPKPPSSQMTPQHPVASLVVFVEHATAPLAIKVPCHDRRDVQWAADLPGLFPRVPLFLSVVTEQGGLDGTFAKGWVDTPDDLMKRTLDVVSWAQQEPTLAEARIFPQVHYLLWGNVRGH